MTVVWGGTLAAGLLLVLSPWLWPRHAGPARPAPSVMRRLLEDAGYAHVPARVAVIVATALAVSAAAVAWLVVPLPTLAILGGSLGLAAPFFWLRGRARRRQRARRALWPDICDLLIASVRAGMSLPGAIAALGTSAPPQLRPAFVAFEADMTASGHFDSSTVRLKALLADPVADRIIETLRMARQVGGTELVPVLRALASSVRADTTLRAEVEARQSWIRGAAVLGVVAPWVILALLAMRPEGARAYSSPEGIVMTLVGAAVSFVAFRLMLRLGRLPQQRRWLG